MSTSSPSRRSTRSTTPKWRSTLSTSKSQQSASVSLVFAQPEQGAKLQSAVDRLPRRFDECSSSASSIMSKKRERLRSTSTLAPESEADADRKRTRTEPAVASTEVAIMSPLDQSQVAPGDVVEPQQVTCEAPETSSDILQSTQLLTSPTPLPPPSVDVAERLCPRPTSSPPRSSWFGTLSRTSRKETGAAANRRGQIALLAPQTQTMESAPASPRRTLDPLIAGVDTRPHQSEHTAPSHTQSIPFPVSHSSPTASVSHSPRSPEIAVSASMAHRVESLSISSVDDEVPRPRLTSGASLPADASPPVLQRQSDEATRTGRKPSITSLNPSTSRFALLLPLLGRPKVLPQQAVVSTEEITPETALVDLEVAADGKLDYNSVPQAADGSVTSASPSAEHTELLVPLTSPPLEQGTMSQDVPLSGRERPTETAVEAPSTSSWWDYIGWSNSPQALTQTVKDTETLEAEPAPSSNSDTTALLQLPPIQIVTEDPLPSTTPIVDDAPARESSVGTDRKETTEAPANPPTNVPKPPSVFSAETAKSATSVWYSPWAWYTASPSTATAGDTQSAPASPEVADSAESIGQPAKTESEMVKERALAREGLADEPLPALMVTAESEEALTTVVPSPVAESQNPIERTLSTSRSGWVSFFMSRALVTKSVTDDGKERDENGIEVMTIDEEAEEHTSSTPVPISGGAQPPQQLQTQPSPAMKLPLQSNRHEHKKSTGSLSTVSTPANSRRVDGAKSSNARTPSPAPSSKSNITVSTSPRVPPARNLVLPSWEDSFLSPPRSNIIPKPQPGKSKLSKTLSLVSGVLFNKDEPEPKGKGKERERHAEFLHFGKELPKAIQTIGEQLDPYLLNGGCRVVVIGVAGWSPGAVTRTLAGGLPSSSSKFVDMACQALGNFEQEQGFQFKKITKIPLEGDGPIERKVSKLHDHLLGDEDWMEDLHAADVIFVASHSQGSIVATHLVDRLLRDGHILTSRSVDLLTKATAAITPGGSSLSTTQAQRICFLALCGIHLGPLRYLGTSSLLQPYIQYFENAAARELFEFQNTESRLSKNYVKALRNVMDHDTKMVYMASLNDQVVPIYSGLFTAASHPRILRALYIDGDAYHSSDFLSNLLVLLIRIMNSGLSDSGLLIHLSEATAGTLSGVGHSSIYEESATFSLAVKYFFLSTDGDVESPQLLVEPFNAVIEQNDYEIPWSLRDMIADERVAYFFAREFAQLRDAFDDWQPKTSILRDVKRKLQPIQRLTSLTPSTSKL
ncbi:uncharacterized protein FIBRA_06324 [Fibroporia radiculosa]|uniref:YMC020W-like alpha/beta hydrolase domain-containing protein n=1 Tax=Fibroporia radiculosa TaxID=599839 RepID=J4HYX8_9APHY|nr:uncharacterized protein FIBRA_06324 [Fibroporia radiculosa]CCM04162.1 predicted protein [Fibroporia radiculosa]